EPERRLLTITKRTRFPFWPKNRQFIIFLRHGSTDSFAFLMSCGGQSSRGLSKRSILCAINSVSSDGLEPPPFILPYRDPYRVRLPTFFHRSLRPWVSW